MMVPGLLQTGEYARAVMTESGHVPAGEIEDRLVVKLRRHSVLQRQNPPRLLAIVDELALRRPVGGAEVLRRQLEHLVRESGRPNIAVRVVPSDRANVGYAGPFQILERSDAHTVVFLENLASSLFLEERKETDVYIQAAHSLLARALDEKESVDLIAAMARELDTEAGVPWDRRTYAT